MTLTLPSFAQPSTKEIVVHLIRRGGLERQQPQENRYQRLRRFAQDLPELREALDSPEMELSVVRASYRQDRWKSVLTRMNLWLKCSSQDYALHATVLLLGSFVVLS